MINKERTKLKYGHVVEDLAPNSTEKVIWNCDKCNSERVYTYSYYLKKSKLSFEKHDGHELCQKCSHSHRIGQSSKLETTKYPAIALPPEVNVQETINVFGHDPQNLSPWSRGYVIMNCHCCNKETETRRCSLNTYKSILADGHFKCTGCWTKERRAGVKVSDETKLKQKEAQQKRRHKEKVKELEIPERYSSVAMASGSGYSSLNPVPKNGGQLLQFPKKEKK